MVSLPGKSFRPETRIRKESRKITDQAARIHLSEKKVEREGIGVRMTINKGDGAPGETRTPDPLLRRQLTALIRTCRSERKARENQQLVINGDKLLTPFSSPLSRRFATICHN